MKVLFTCTFSYFALAFSGLLAVHAAEVLESSSSSTLGTSSLGPRSSDGATLTHRSSIPDAPDTSPPLHAEDAPAGQIQTSYDRKRSRFDRKHAPLPHRLLSGSTATDGLPPHRVPLAYHGSSASTTVSAPDGDPQDLARLRPLPPDSRLTAAALARHNAMAQPFRVHMNSRDRRLSAAASSTDTAHVSSISRSSLGRTLGVAVPPHVWHGPALRDLVQYSYLVRVVSGDDTAAAAAHGGADMETVAAAAARGKRIYQAGKKRRPGYLAARREAGNARRRAERVVARRRMRATARGHWLSDRDPCAVCLQPNGRDGTYVPYNCGHALHARCLARWRAVGGEPADSCPTCRQKFSAWEELPAPASSSSSSSSSQSARPQREAERPHGY